MKLYQKIHKITKSYSWKKNWIDNINWLLQRASKADILHVSPSSEQSLFALVCPSLWRRAKAWNISFSNSLWWPLYTIILVDRTKLFLILLTLQIGCDIFNLGMGLWQDSLKFVIKITTEDLKHIKNLSCLWLRSVSQLVSTTSSH